ncbi:MAG TPA: ParB/RepB/Spo0J family partition protein [Blastocatellia bacterium]|nr:ParB/RepB/Spo0J family partition protein [Blastocatellia bacterium]
MSKKALGRGLSALFTQTTSLDQDLVELGIDQIDPTESQPRQIFKQDRLEELAASIRSSGVIQPLLVRRQGERFQLIAGERRWRAAQLAGLHRIPCVIKNVTDHHLLELSLIENLQREDLNPIEEANAYKSLIEQLKTTQEEIAKRIGKDRSSVTNSLRLLRLPMEIQALLEQEKLSMGHARALLGIESSTEQNNLAHEIVTRGLSVREAERLVKEALSPSKSRGGKTAKGSYQNANPNVVAAQAKLKRRLGAPVNIKFENDGGLIEIKFASMDDLTRIYDLIMEKGGKQELGS